MRGRPADTACDCAGIDGALCAGAGVGAGFVAPAGGWTLTLAVADGLVAVFTRVFTAVVTLGPLLPLTAALVPVVTVAFVAGVTVAFVAVVTVACAVVVTVAFAVVVTVGVGACWVVGVGEGTAVVATDVTVVSVGLAADDAVVVTPETAPVAVVVTVVTAPEISPDELLWLAVPAAAQAGASTAPANTAATEESPRRNRARSSRFARMTDGYPETCGTTRMRVPMLGQAVAAAGDRPADAAADIVHARADALERTARASCAGRAT